MRLRVRGFTLIELLVVIAIIAILAAVLLSSFDEARKSARDDARKAELKELQLALELYKAQNGRYPAAGCNRGASWTSQAPTYGNCTEYIAGLAPEYVSELPIDPNAQANNQGYLYRTNSSGSSYKLLAYLTVESKTVGSFVDEFSRWPYASCGYTVAQTETTYAVYSAGAECW